MANKKLKVGGGENLKLSTKKDKTAKKPKWQAKIGGKKGKEIEKAETVDETAEVVVDATPAQDSPTLPPEPTESPVVATTSEAASGKAATTEAEATTPDAAPKAPTTYEPTTKMPRKLKVKADAPPKKLSMMTAAIQVLQARKVAMTCPELIDVMATEGLWTLPGGKMPANTLYAAISRDIKEQGKASVFRKAERGKV